jgi:uncharacterized protein YdeI (YjbR/CyaY-like superfamily)
VSEPEVVAPKDRAALRRWLQRHHAQPDGVWLLILKKGSTAPGVTYEEAVLEGLCWGWIDSKASAHDDDHYRQWFAPRKPKSAWSASNKRRVAELTRAGLMAEPGLAAVRAAKRNGAWDALNTSEVLKVPPDLARAFRQHRPAKRHWDAFPPGVRKQILEWINAAKRPETRARRIDETARLAAENVRANQRRPES